jgi:hypothetical protein
MSEKELLESKIKLLGCFTNKLSEGEGVDMQLGDVVNDCLRLSAHRKKNISFEPVSIAVEANTIAVVDSKRFAM